METLNLTSIKKELTVAASQKTAFDVFTQQISLWWPNTHHIGSTPMTGMVIEPFIGGRWYTTHEDGAEMLNGKVLDWQPNGLLVLAWQLTAEYEFNPELITEVEVQFIPEGSKKTRIKFEHKNMQRLNNAESVKGMNAGWGDILMLYKKMAEA
jgi:uncharacterized protein YndB with AHSA1/START domain